MKSYLTTKGDLCCLYNYQLCILTYHKRYVSFILFVCFSYFFLSLYNDVFCLRIVDKCPLYSEPLNQGHGPVWSELHFRRFGLKHAHTFEQHFMNGGSISRYKNVKQVFGFLIRFLSIHSLVRVPYFFNYKTGTPLPKQSRRSRLVL